MTIASGHRRNNFFPNQPVVIGYVGTRLGFLTLSHMTTIVKINAKDLVGLTQTRDDDHEKMDLIMVKRPSIILDKKFQK